MAATFGLERHGGHPGSGLGAAFCRTQPRRQTSDPCTNVPVARALMKPDDGTDLANDLSNNDGASGSSLAET
jgi:hypothetical protein